MDGGTVRKGAAQGGKNKNKCCPAEIYELQPLARVCFMLFDGSGGERLTVCQCHSLSADVSEQGTGLRGEINKLLFSRG